MASKHSCTTGVSYIVEINHCRIGTDGRIYKLVSVKISSFIENFGKGQL